VLRVGDRDPRVIHSYELVRFRVRMESKLYFVQAARNAEERHICALNDTDELLLAIGRITRIVSRHWHEWLESLLKVEILKCKSNIHLIVKFDEIECALELLHRQLIINKGVLRN